MSRIMITENATRGLERCRTFLADKNILATKHAAEAISKSFILLEKYPDMGRPFSELPELRELVIKFGVTGYIALYRYNPKVDCIYLLAFRHQKEVGYE